MSYPRKRPANGPSAFLSPLPRTGESYQDRRSSQADVFAEINSQTIAELWVMLGLPGEPKPHGCMRSPIREEGTPSFSIYDHGTRWKDHGTGEGGDGVEFVRLALRTDHAGVRGWWLERSGIDYFDHGDGSTSSRPAKTPEPAKAIQWPCELVTGTPETWETFAAKLRIPRPAVVAAVGCGTLRFCKVDGLRCFAVTDGTNRAAEIRRIDGGLFGGRKAYPLAGVDKRWLPGAEMLKHARTDAGLFLTEGPKDLLAALGIYSTYRRDLGGRKSWIPAAVLGANCRTLHPELIPWIRGRRVRMVPDGDEAGDKMAKTWKALLLELRCTVDVVKMPPGKDLFDVRGEMEPEGLFR